MTWLIEDWSDRTPFSDLYGAIEEDFFETTPLGEIVEDWYESTPVTQELYEDWEESTVLLNEDNHAIFATPSTGLPNPTVSTGENPGIVPTTVYVEGAPTVDDDSGAGYSVNDSWYDADGDAYYVLTDATEGAAVWEEVTAEEVPTLYPGNPINFVAINSALEKLIVPVPVIQVLVGGIDIGPYITSFRFLKPLGGIQSCEFTAYQHSPGGLGGDDTPVAHAYAALQDAPSDFNPLEGGGGSYAGKIWPHKQDKTRNFVVKITVNGQTWTSTPMMPNSPRFDGYTLSWGGRDQSALLEIENQTMDDILADQDPPVVKMAHATIKEICAEYGINHVVCTFPDYQIRMLRRNGRPLDWVDSIARVYQAHRIWRGDILYFEPAKDYASPKGMQWELIDVLQLKNDLPLELEGRDAVKNKVTISRLEPQKGILGNQECIGGQCLGRTVNITLDTPSRSITPQVEVLNGRIDDWVGFDANDNPIIGGGGSSGLFRSATPIARVEATYYPPTYTTGAGAVTIGAQSGPQTKVWTPRYKIYLWGGGRGGNISFSSTYTYTKTDTRGTVAIYGENPEYGNIDAEIIPTAAVAEASVDAFLFENARRVLILKPTSPYVNPFMEPNDILKVTDWLTDQSSLAWLVEEHQLSFSGGNFEMQLELRRGPVT